MPVTFTSREKVTGTIFSFFFGKKKEKSIQKEVTLTGVVTTKDKKIFFMRKPFSIKEQPSLRN